MLFISFLILTWTYVCCTWLKTCHEIFGRYCVKDPVYIGVHQGYDDLWNDNYKLNHLAWSCHNIIKSHGFTEYIFFNVHIQYILIITLNRTDWSNHKCWTAILSPDTSHPSFSYSALLASAFGSCLDSIWQLSECVAWMLLRCHKIKVCFHMVLYVSIYCMCVHVCIPK